MESSHDYYLAPDLIREEALARGMLDEAFEAVWAPLKELELEWPNAMNAHTPSGALGDARKGTREVGERLIESSHRRAHRNPRSPPRLPPLEWAATRSGARQSQVLGSA